MNDDDDFLWGINKRSMTISGQMLRDHSNPRDAGSFLVWCVEQWMLRLAPNRQYGPLDVGDNIVMLTAADYVELMKKASEK